MTKETSLKLVSVEWFILVGGYSSARYKEVWPNLLKPHFKINRTIPWQPATDAKFEVFRIVISKAIQRWTKGTQPLKKMEGLCVHARGILGYTELD